MLAALACALAIMCYAEFASTIPVAGSAYTYTYATLGEFLAWIIGWDLILELLTAAAVIAKYWGIYLATVFELFDVHIPTTFGVFGLAMDWRSEEHTSELQSLMRNSYAVFCLKKKNNT